MRPPAHLAVSTVSGILSYVAFDSFEVGASCFLSGILIDVDHVFDYLTRIKIRTLSVSDFFHTELWGPQGKLRLVFHAWEYIPLLFLMFLWPDLREISTGLIIGMALHLVLDHLYNKGHPLTYSIIFRWLNNFDFNCFFPMIPVEDDVHEKRRLKPKYERVPWKGSAS